MPHDEVAQELGKLGGVGVAATAASLWLDAPDPIQFALAVAFFALFGGLARLLRRGSTGLTWDVRVGYLMTSIFAGWMFALVGWGHMVTTLNLAFAGFAAYFGDVALVWLARTKIGFDVAKEEEERPTCPLPPSPPL